MPLLFVVTRSETKSALLKMICLSALPNHEESTIKKYLFDKWIYSFGKPNTIISDNGKEFQSQLIQDLCNKIGIKWIFLSPYDHRSIGLAERAIRTTRDMIVSLSKCERGKC